MSNRYKYEVALSFADEDIEVAERISTELKNQNIPHFFYPDYEEMLFAGNLLEELLKIYGEESKYVLQLISENYARRKWADIERDIVQMKRVPVMLLMLDESQKNGGGGIIYGNWEGDPIKAVKLIKGRLDQYILRDTESESNQYNKTLSEDVEKHLNPIASARPADIRWEKIKTEADDREWDNNLSQLNDTPIIYLSASDNQNKWALIHWFQRELIKKERDLAFNELILPDVDTSFPMDLNWLLTYAEKQKSLFVVVDLEQYQENRKQREYLHSLNKFYENEVPKLKENHIFIVNLISSALADQIKDPDNKEFTKSYHIWEINANPSPDPDEIFNKLSIIHQVVLFAGAFFNNISLRNFDMVVKYLLIGPQPDVPVVIEEFSETEDGDVKSVRHISTRNKIDVWESYKSKILNDCSLLGQYSGAMYSINFTYPDFSEKLKIYLKEKQHYFWQTQLSILDNQKLAFDFTLPEQVVDKVNILIVEAHLSDPDYYDYHWFKNITYFTKNNNGECIVKDDLMDGESLDNIFWAFLEMNRLEDSFYNRLVKLFARMLDSPRTQQIVNSYLNELLSNNKRHEHLLPIVKRLTDLQSFDKFKWIKQLIERGTHVIKVEAYQWLVYKIAKTDISATWAAVKTWMPIGKDPDHYSPSNNYSSFFIIHYHVNQVRNLSIRDYGKWPNLYPLFTFTTVGEKGRFEHLDFIVVQMLQKGVEVQFRQGSRELLFPMIMDLLFLDIFRDEEKEFIERKLKNVTKSMSFQFHVLLADIFETWFHILRGFDEKCHNNARKIISRVLGIIKRYATPEKLDLILTQWENKSNIYLKYSTIIDQYIIRHNFKNNDDTDQKVDESDQDTYSGGNNETEFDEDDGEMDVPISNVRTDQSAAKTDLRDSWPARVINFRESLIIRSQNIEFLLQEYKKLNKKQI
jgi:hypothetical protein